MAKVVAPLLAFSASGTVAKTQVYASWRGIQYARRWLTPANPQSTEQTVTRNAFTWLNATWKVSPANFRQSWTLAAKGRPLTDRNLWIKQNLPVLRGNADLTGIILSPGAAGGLPGELTITPGAGQLTLDLAAPSVMPVGWTITKAIFAIIAQQSPETGTDYEIKSAEDATSTYQAVFTGLGSATDWLCGGWFEFAKSALASDVAYGPSTGALGTTS